MHSDHDIFLKAVEDHRKILLTFSTDPHGGNKVRLVGPIYYGLSRLAEDSLKRYHFWDLQRNQTDNLLNLLPYQIVSMKLTEEDFNLADSITYRDVSGKTKSDSREQKPELAKDEKTI